MPDLARMDSMVRTLRTGLDRGDEAAGSWFNFESAGVRSRLTQLRSAVDRLDNEQRKAVLAGSLSEARWQAIAQGYASDLKDATKDLVTWGAFLDQVVVQTGRDVGTGVVAVGETALAAGESALELVQGLAKYLPWILGGGAAIAIGVVAWRSRT